MLVPEAPWGNLTHTPLPFGDRGGVLLQDTEDAPPMMAVEVVPQDFPGPQGTWEDGKMGMGNDICPSEN